MSRKFPRYAELDSKIETLTGTDRDRQPVRRPQRASWSPWTSLCVHQLFTDVLRDLAEKVLDATTDLATDLAVVTKGSQRRVSQTKPCSDRVEEHSVEDHEKNIPLWLTVADGGEAFVRINESIAKALFEIPTIEPRSKRLRIMTPSTEAFLLTLTRIPQNVPISENRDRRRNNSKRTDPQYVSAIYDEWPIKLAVFGPSEVSFQKPGYVYYFLPYLHAHPPSFTKKDTLALDMALTVVGYCEKACQTIQRLKDKDVLYFATAAFSASEQGDFGSDARWSNLESPFLESTFMPGILIAIGESIATLQTIRVAVRLAKDMIGNIVTYVD